MKASALIKTEDLVLIFPDDGTPEDERTLNITVSPGVLTPNRDAAIRNSEDDDVEPIVDLIVDIVKKWDLLDDKGKVIPLKKDVLMDQPIVVLAMVLNEITSVLQAQAKDEGKISAAT
jgi:hypothetical protein